MGDSAPMIEDAAFHRLGHESIQQPLKLDLGAPWEQFDGAVVTTEAKLLNRQDAARWTPAHAPARRIVF